MLGSDSLGGHRFGVQPTHRRTSSRSGITLVSVLAVAPTACSTTEAEPSDLTLLPAELMAAVEVPLSANASITLADASTACVIESYNVRVVCVRSDGSTVGAFGTKGEGPGEFGTALGLMRGPGGTVGVFDGSQSRLTVFEPTGALLSLANTPLLFRPMGPFGETVLGSYVVYAAAPSGALVAEVDLNAGAILQERALPHPSELGLSMDCERGYSTGAVAPGGRLAFSTCTSDVVLWGTGDNVTTFRDPTYLPELPSERDIEKHREGMRGAFGVAPPETELLQFAQTPKRAFVRGRALAYDVWGRLWAATQRDRDKFSYLNVFSDTTYAGSVRVRHRVEGFDLLDSILAVLVERPPDDPDGIPTRGIDWYRIEPPRP